MMRTGIRRLTKPLTGSLRTKLIAWFFVPTAIILVAVALVNFNSYQNVTEDLVIERDKDLTQLWAGQLAANLDGFPQTLSTVSRTLGISEQSESEIQASLLEASPDLRVFDGGVVILDTFGTVTATQPFSPAIVGQDWSDRTDFRQMLRSPEPVFSNVVFDAAQDAEVIEVAVPIIGDRGEFLGSMIGKIRLRANSISAFYGGILRLRIGNGGTYIVDGNGKVLYHDDPNQVGNDFGVHEPVEQVLRGQVGAIRNRSQSGTDQVSAYSPIPGTTWGLVTEESWDSLISGSRSTQRFLLLLLALGVAVPAVFVAIGLKRVMRPVEELKLAVKEVARGNFTQTIAVHSGDEIEELAVEFNLMAGQLRSSYEQLEQRVAERTEELRGLQEAERELAEVTARLAETGRIVTANLEIEEVYERFAEEVKKLVEFDRISVNVIDEQSGTFVFRYVSGELESGRKIGDVPPLEGNQTGEVFETGKTLVSQDVAADTRFLGDQTLLDSGFRSSIVLPLKYQNLIIGVLSLRSRKQGMYGPRNQSILEQLADQIAPAVENARLYAESQKTQEDLRQAEQKYRRIFDDSKETIFVTSREGLILDVNQAGLDVFGYKADELIGFNVRDMCEDPGEHSDLVASVDAEGSVIDHEIRLLRKDGSVADCVIDLIAQRDDQDIIVAYQGMVRDITEDKLAEKVALEQAQEVAVLEERNRMAREIHDTMAQAFTGIVLQMEAAEQSMETSPDALPDHLNQARTLAREGLQEARRSIWGLMPQALERSTLDEALQQAVHRFDAEGQSVITFSQLGPVRELPPEVQTVVLRVCQESLTNIRRHAEADKVDIVLEYQDRSVELSVQDDGAGFDQATLEGKRTGGSFGLTGMRQRAEQIKGSLLIVSAKDRGTLIRLTIPTP